MSRASAPFTLSRVLALAVGVPLVSVLFLLGSPAKVNAQATPADPDWPCVQRLLPEIAGGMVWAGPPLDDVGTVEAGFGELPKELAARRVPIEDAERQIEAYAASLNGATDKAENLTALFRATLEIINADRSSIINGIKKFSRGQRTLADKINARNREIQAMDRSDVLAHDAAVAERDWDVRIFEDRRQSLVYLCEQPVLLEQRAFALARSLVNHLD